MTRWKSDNHHLPIKWHIAELARLASRVQDSHLRTAMVYLLAAAGNQIESLSPSVISEVNLNLCHCEAAIHLIEPIGKLIRGEASCTDRLIIMCLVRSLSSCDGWEKIVAGLPASSATRLKVFENALDSSSDEAAAVALAFIVTAGSIALAKENTMCSRQQAA